MRIYGVTGRKNAGKTTLVAALVTEFSARGLRVSTLKRSHHDADIDQPGRDSHRHRSAGAVEVILSTPQRWAHMHELRGAEEPPLADLLAKLSPVDLVLIEGWKDETHPKIEVFRAAINQPPLAPDHPNIRAIASDCGDQGWGLPVLDLNDIATIADFIAAEVGIGG